MAHWFWIFFFYSWAGCLLERAYAHRTSGEAHPVRRCMLLLPLCPVYGLSMTALLTLPPSMRQGLWLPVAGAAAATFMEYFYHLLCQRLFGVRFWDYSGVPGNVEGRVCVPFSLAWGGLSALAVWIIQPPLEALIACVPPALTLTALLVFTADAVCSARLLAVTHSVSALRGGA